LQAGLPKNTVVEKIVTDGVVASKEVATSLLDLKEDEPISKQLANKLHVLVTLATHPKYIKFFNMLKMGVSKEIVREKMIGEGVDPELLQKDPNEKMELFDGPLVMEPNKNDEEKKKLIPICEHIKYAKYFKMLKVGTPIGAVQNKMQAEGLDPSIIEQDPNTMVPEKDDEEHMTVEKMVKVSEHPKYEKYFKMLKTGVPRGAVLNKMKAEGVDESFLDKDPDEMICLDPGKKKKSVSDKVKVSEHPIFAKYFKMLKVGTPKPAVQLKMQQEKLDPSILDKDPDELISLDDEEDDEKEEQEGPQVKVSEHPKYAKFFKMLKVGTPKPAVQLKMQQEKLDPSILDKDPEEMIPLDDNPKKKKNKGGKLVAASEHPKYVKYFKMLKSGVPLEAIQAKMKVEGVDPSVLEKNPTDMIPLNDEVEEDTGPTVKVSEHPSYSKYFKMLKVGLPPDAVKMKMKSEGVDPSYLDKNPDDLVPISDSKKEGKVAASVAVAAKPKPRKKKLHWKAVDVSKMTENSLWADEDDEMEILLDEEEFNKLFVESAVEESKQSNKPIKEPKKQKVVLIDMKRAQNGSIALARIKFPHNEMKSKVLNMDDHGLTTDQLKSMIEYLPKPEEAGPLRQFKGDDDLIGIAEKYMLTMLSCDSAKQRIECMIYKQQFRSRYSECYDKIKKIEQACDDVKMSVKLKKVLKTILKVGNQLNDGEDHKGFSVESLLKLQSAKAFDKKTTVLTYVVRLVARNDEDSLRFPEELKNISEASRMTMDMIISEKSTLKQEFDINFKVVENIRAKDLTSNTDAMIDFFAKADELCKKLDGGFEKVRDKFTKVLEYFGEEPNMTCQDFFSTLSKFVQVS
jgi:hypothetical protein